MNTLDISNLMLEIESTNPLSLQIKGKKDNSPRAIGFYNSKKQFIPDLVAKYEHKRDFYAIEKIVPEADINLFTFKWILFSAEARKFSGSFFLVIPKSKSKLCEKIILDKKLDVKLIKL